MKLESPVGRLRDPIEMLAVLKERHGLDITYRRLWGATVEGKVISAEDLNRVIARLEGLGFFHISFSRTWGADSLFINRRILSMSQGEYRYIKYLARPARLIRKKLFGQSS